VDQLIEGLGAQLRLCPPEHVLECRIAPLEVAVVSGDGKEGDIGFEEVTEIEAGRLG
jgi:hypothetical protein